MKRIDKRVFQGLVLLVWVYLGLRAWFVPVVHDEAATFLHYLQVDQFIPFFAMWDANNHVLNSALAYLSVNGFGTNTFWLRLPNLLFFPLYAYFVYQLVQSIKWRVVRWLAMLAMLTASFLVEFFALARGYGMSMALVLGAVYFALRYFRTVRLADQWRMWGFLFLALLANMSLMPTAGILWAMLGVFLFRERPQPIAFHAMLWVGLGGAVLLAGALYAWKMKVLGLLYTGALDGFIDITALSFARFQFALPEYWFAALLTLAGLIAGSFLLYRGWSRRSFWSAGPVVGGLLIFNGAGAFVLANVFGVNYPDERTALYFLPFLMLSVAYAANEAGQQVQGLRWLALPLVYFPLQLGLTANLSTSQLWDYLHVDRQLYQTAAQLQADTDRPLRISGGRMHELSWAFDNITYGGGLQLMERPHFPDTTADLIIARDDMDFASWRADTLFYNPKSGFALLQPAAAASEASEGDTLAVDQAYSGTDTYFNLASWPVDSAAVSSGIIALDLQAQSFGAPLHVQLVIASEDDDGKTRSYDAVPLFWVRKHWDGDTYGVRRYYQFPIGASRAIVYLWNIGGYRAEMACSPVVRYKAPG